MYFILYGPGQKSPSDTGQQENWPKKCASPSFTDFDIFRIGVKSHFKNGIYRALGSLCVLMLVIALAADGQTGGRQSVWL